MLEQKNHSKVVKNLKNVMSTRCIKLYASFDGLYCEYVRLLEILNLIIGEKESGDSLQKAFVKDTHREKAP